MSERCDDWESEQHAKQDWEVSAYSFFVVFLP